MQRVCAVVRRLHKTKEPSPLPFQPRLFVMPCPRNWQRGAAIAALSLAIGLIVMAICVQRPNESGHRIIVTEQRKSSAEEAQEGYDPHGGDLQDLRDKARAFYLIATTTTTSTTMSPENATKSENASGSLDMRQMAHMGSSTTVRIEHGSYATIASLAFYLHFISHLVLAFERVSVKAAPIA